METEGYAAFCRDALNRELLPRDAGFARCARSAASCATPHAPRAEFGQSSILEFGANEHPQNWFLQAASTPSFPENSPLRLIKAGSLARMAKSKPEKKPEERRRSHPRSVSFRCS
jgi:hypothetical protein